MATSDPLASLSQGTFPLQFAPTAAAALAGSKRAVSGEVVALRYAFKPASITAQTTGALEPSRSAAGGRILAYDLPANGSSSANGGGSSGSSQVFDVREEQSKTRECVIVWDEAKQAFILHALPSTYHLTLNRNLSAQRAAGVADAPADEPRKKARAENSLGSRESSPGQSLAASARAAPPPARSRPGSTALPAGVAAITETAPVRPARKKPTAKKGAAATAAAALAAAGLAAPAAPAPSPKGKRKAAAAAAPKKAAPKKKAGAKTAAAAPAPKVKSVEIIEDSADDDDDGMDEFANMLGEAVAAPELPGYDDDEEDEEEDDDDDELGGAQFAGYHNESAADEEAEWI